MYDELFFVFFLTLVLIWVIRSKAAVWGLIDIPNTRSMHNIFTARGAGIAFYLSVMLSVSIFHFELITHYFWTVLGISLVFMVGLLDDHHDTAPKSKFIVLAVATIFLSFDGLVIDDIGLFFGIHLHLLWFAIPFTIFAVSGFTNALNLIDGLDGLATMISLVILLGFFTLGYRYEDSFMMVFSSTFAVTLCAFLFYNWHPASIFMGDSGSLTLGFVISILAIKSLDYIPAVGILFLAAVPILDTVVVMIHRKRKGSSIFAADKCHMHHILKRFLKENTVATVFLLSFLQLIYTLFALQFAKKIDEGILLILFFVNMVVFYNFLDLLRKKQKKECL
ncbi:Undecaprenyl-phosphate N-acetylglucosaminyl 1-phosphate transferase [hydrothermal vent metagenome]|uniref:Undecaprenyl-phosphate N-acetylglucosaminyl 1-phosphate transferase n=1 Tax=hydrothermal vent metagenome TaxID=652676 RepID=A0A1W1C2T3_9ZZZZ